MSLHPSQNRIGKPPIIVHFQPDGKRQMSSEESKKAKAAFPSEHLTATPGTHKIAGMRQWHPIFGEVLRDMIELTFDIDTAKAVGDTPREADLVLLRRSPERPTEFTGLWRHLTFCNIMEYKGPTVSPRSDDIERLIELGLGVGRRINEERRKQRQPQLPPEEISYWYLTNRLGRRFLNEIRSRVGHLVQLGDGLWRCVVLNHLVFWVSTVDLPVEYDTVPLHVLSREPVETQCKVAELVMEHPKLQEWYSGWMSTLHPQAWKEAEAMARTARKPFEINLRPVIRSLGIEEVIRQAGEDRLIAALGRERLIEQIGEKEFIRHFGMDRLVASLSPKELRELKRRLNGAGNSRDE